jgi:membrane protein DedA with SNARE-associated domain
MHLEFFSLDTIQEWIQQYGYWIIFFGIMLENAGIPLPGETITLVGGFLAGNGELTYPLVLLSAVLIELSLKIKTSFFIKVLSNHWMG